MQETNKENKVRHLSSREVYELYGNIIAEKKRSNPQTFGRKRLMDWMSSEYDIQISRRMSETILSWIKDDGNSVGTSQFEEVSINELDDSISPELSSGDKSPTLYDVKPFTDEEVDKMTDDELIESATYRPMSSKQMSRIFKLHELGEVKLRKVGLNSYPVGDTGRFQTKLEYDILSKNVDARKFLERMYETLNKTIVSPRRTIQVEQPKEGKLFVPSLADVHVMKFCAEYDFDMAMHLLEAGTEALLDKVRHENVSTIMLPVGNDLLHIDNIFGTTTAGTKMEYCGDYQTAYIKVAEWLVTYIDRISNEFNVEVIPVPSNHDRHSVFTLNVLLEQMFKNKSTVTVDNTYEAMKLRRWNDILLMFYHGDDIAMDKIPMQMLVKASEMGIGDGVKYREALLAHKHQRSKSVYVSDKDTQGVLVRYMYALSRPDAWHKKKGFDLSHTACQGILYNAEEYEAEFAIGTRRLLKLSGYGDKIESN